MPVISETPPLKRIPKGMLNLDAFDTWTGFEFNGIDLVGNVKLGDTYDRDERGVTLMVVYEDGSVLRLKPIIVKSTSNVYQPGVCLELMYVSKYVPTYTLPLSDVEFSPRREYFAVDDYDIAIVAFKRRYHSEHPDQCTALGKIASHVLSIKR